MPVALTDKVLREKIAEYFLDSGFDYGGEWYMRKSWLPDFRRKKAEEKDLIEVVGNAEDLRERGVEVPQSRRYDGGVNAQIYKVIDEGLNNLISNSQK